MTSLLCFINKWGTDAHSLETAAEPPLRRTLRPTPPPELTDASLDPLAAPSPFAGGASALDKLLARLQARCSGWGKVESEHLCSRDPDLEMGSRASSKVYWGAAEMWAS